MKAIENPDTFGCLMFSWSRKWRIITVSAVQQLNMNISGKYIYIYQAKYQLLAQCGFELGPRVPESDALTIEPPSRGCCTKCST